MNDLLWGFLARDVTWLFVAFLAAWIVIGGYLFSLAARQRKLEKRVQDLDR